jgi:hypothetical protein
MIFTTITMLPSTTYGVPSGNYDGSSLDWFSDGVPAANYYKGQGNIQTITIDISDFYGIISLQASLGTLKESASWAEVSRFENPNLNSGFVHTSSPITGVFPFTQIGNYVWLRAEILDFTAGTINSITVAY